MLRCELGRACRE